jgi:G3E family GTPase
MESHRISSINYGKLARTITVELNLPVKDRNSGGAECVKVSRTEIDRLIEQSPAIPKSVLFSYESKFAGKGLAEPEIVVINKVDIYEDRENKVAITVAEAGLKLKDALNKAKKPLFQIKSSESPTAERKENLNKELKSLPKLVSTVNTKVLSNVFSRLSPKRDPPKLPVFEEIIPEVHQVHEVHEVHEEHEEHEETEPVVINMESEIVPESITPVGETVGEIVDTLVEDTIKSSGTISDDLEELRSKGLVSKRP